MRKILAVGVLALALTASTSFGALLGTYTFTGADPGGDTSVPTAANMTFGAFSRVGVTAVSVNDVFQSGDWTQGTPQDFTEYVQFVLTPNSGYRLDLTSITFDVARQNDHSPHNGEVRIFLGNTLILKGSQTFATDPAQNVNFNFTDFSTANNESVTVRFYGWNADGSQWLQFDNVAVNGSVTAVPEPVHYALGVFGLMFVGLRGGRFCLRRFGCA
jgi:hypothetical protein